MCKPVAGFVTANLKGQIDSSVYFILWRKLCSLLARFDQLFRNMRCEGSIVGAIGYRRLYDRVPQAISEEVHMCYGKGRTHSPYVRSSRVQPPNGHPHSLLQRKSGRTDRSCRCHMRSIYSTTTLTSVSTWYTAALILHASQLEFLKKSPRNRSKGRSIIAYG